MFRIIIIVCSALFVLCAEASAISMNKTTGLNCDEEKKSVKAEIIKQIAVKEFWHSANSIVYRSQGSTILYLPPGIEGVMYHGEWKSLGIIMAGLGDIEEIPVAVRILTKKSDIFLKNKSISKSNAAPNAVAYFGTSDENINLRFEVTPFGQVLIDDELIGLVE